MRRAVTLIGLLVVVAGIAIFIGLLLPAAHRTAWAAARYDCGPGESLEVTPMDTEEEDWL